MELKNAEGDRDLVEEIMEENRIDPVTHPIMHEYFATEEFHKIWMNWMKMILIIELMLKINWLKIIKDYH